MKINHVLTETDIKNIDVISQLEHQIQIQETNESCWVFDKIISMRRRFYKTDELNGSNYVKFPLRSTATLYKEKKDKYCFRGIMLAYFHACENSHPSRVRSYIQKFDGLNTEGFDLANGFTCSDMHRFEKLNSLSINIFELNFYQDKIKWKHKLIPIEIGKNESERVVDLLIYKNHYTLFKKINVFSGDHHLILNVDAV